MHPAVYIELKQTLREFKVILFIIAGIVVSRIFLGDYGHLLNLFIIFPVTAGALGTGILAQEYSRDYLKYIYTLPIKRWHFMLIKIMNAAIAVFVFLLVIFLVKWIIPPRYEIPMMPFSTVFNMKYLLFLVITLSVFRFTLGTFVITFFKSPKLAEAVVIILTVIAIVYIVYCFLNTGYHYSADDFIIIFAPTSLVLFFGSFHLFALRNPYLNSNPRLWLTGLLLSILCGAWFFGMTAGITSGTINTARLRKQTETRPVFDKGVALYSVSSDGRFVFVECTDGILDHSAVFDFSGNLVADLGNNSSFYQYELTWQFNHDKRIVLYETRKPILADMFLDKYTNLFAFDLDSCKQYKFDTKSTQKYGYDYEYLCLNNQTMELVGAARENQADYNAELVLFRQSPATGKHTAVTIPESRRVSSHDIKCIDFNRFAFICQDNDDASGQESTNRVILFDMDGKRSYIPIPANLYYGSVKIFGDKCVFRETLSDDYGYSYRVVCRSADNKDTLVLASHELPRISYRQAAEDRYSEMSGADPGISLDVSPQKKWLECYYKDPNEQTCLILMDQQGNRVNVDCSRGCLNRFAPGEMRFIAEKFETSKDESKTCIFYLYDIRNNQTVFVKEFQLDKNISNLCFLDDYTLLYIKHPSPDEQWANNEFLEVFDLRTMQASPFIK